jgi:hypothetical protein
VALKTQILLVTEKLKQLQKVNKTITHKKREDSFFISLFIEGLWLIPVLITLFWELRSKTNPPKIAQNE